MKAKTILTLVFASQFAVIAGAAPVGVTVNDVMLDTDVSGGDGWTYVGSNLTLTNAGPFTLSGTNRAGNVCVVVPQGVTNAVTLSDLVLVSTNENQCAFALTAGANVALSLAGESILQAADFLPGLKVPAGAVLTITNAPEDRAGTLLAYGGGYAAGIGSGISSAVGEVIINGGEVVAGGGSYSPGIGCGYGGTAGSLTINGGEVVAIGHEGAPGIGGGYKRSCGTVTINGGSVTSRSLGYGAGIGNGREAGEGGTVTISGGTVTATGGTGGAGIGGGYSGVSCTVEISGGRVTATGSDFFGAGIGGGAGGGGGTVAISGGIVSANGGDMGAGIGSGGYAGWFSGGDGGTVTISGGTVTANGGDWSAGIGGGDGDACGTVTISGGSVSAVGGKYGAGIGGGNNDENPDGVAGTGGTVTISGGRVTATGGKCAAGIGGGTGQKLAGSTGAVLSVSGGTVFAIGGAGGAPGIGPGLGNVGEGDTGVLPDVSGTSTFTGGSIRIDGGYAAAAPSNATARVWCVTVPGLEPGAEIAISSLGSYGVNDLFADETGALYLWLPDGPYAFTANGTDYTATVDGAPITASGGLVAPVFAADGQAIVVSGATLSIKISNAQSGVRYTLYAAAALDGIWEEVDSIDALQDGDLCFTNISATPPTRFFKVKASTTAP